MGIFVLGVGVAKDGSFSCITKNKTQATGGIKFGGGVAKGASFSCLTTKHRRLGV